jgi:hypothetical protein
MKNEHTEEHFGFDDANGDQYRFDSLARARGWVEDQPETRWCIQKTTTVKYEEYRHPKCIRCSQYMKPWYLNDHNICKACQKIGTS